MKGGFYLPHPLYPPLLKERGRYKVRGAKSFMNPAILGGEEACFWRGFWDVNPPQSPFSKGGGLRVAGDKTTG